ncbi:sulfate permease [Actinokineospora sp. PR83]|uniref:SulP family inorganic anion transporter n=1 Tax=Actinokineospora sp. PR83 TaxID=2884908 RepID=UPI0027DFA64E|nr:sulfate permease [Actinokineospora sp. PR83]
MRKRRTRGWARADVLAGVTVAAYLVPQVMAYAQVAGVPPALGLWTVVVVLPLYAVLGSSPQLSVGPESTTALMTVAVVAPMAHGDPVRHVALAAALAVMVGVVCLVGGLARLGFLADLLSKPILTGYLAGVAVMMVVGQLGRVTGTGVSGASTAEEFRSFLGVAGQAHPPTVLLAAGTLAFLLLGGFLLPRAPMPLLGILGAAAVAAVFSLGAHGVAMVGAVDVAGLHPGVPAVSGADLVALAVPAVGVAVVAYSDTMLTARSFAARNHYRVDAEREMYALGAVSVAAGLAGGFPVSSSGSRTVIGDAMGSRSQLHSVVAAVLVAAVLLWGGGLLAVFPSAALGALVVHAALRLVDVGQFRRLARFRRSELVLALGTTAAVVVLDVLHGVLIAVALSILDLLRRVARPHDGVLGYVPGMAGMHDVADHPGASPVPGLLVYRYDAPLCFANAEDFRGRALAAVDAADPPVRWFLLNAEANADLDVTGIDALEDLRAELAARGIVVALARVKQDSLDDLARAGLVDRIGRDLVFPTLPTAVEAFHRWAAATPMVPARPGPPALCAGPAAAQPGVLARFARVVRGGPDRVR